ncbi:Crp/Fnr family transcriptional regulator [Mucilaginibacter galii]|uniref:Crp/Fnr family transcriptional regulator n=1 Tax=Mucilaginibacter galii TaxID=2005073 RepID=A0A917J9V4_9SPHI|nr:Crp/Fnr family transcriptional regulator [Mucilaginibacter galii]GGI51478.1 Crp/Fnr family transcriptional regulator [Mucilaginibacter galii]
MFTVDPSYPIKYTEFAQALRSTGTYTHEEIMLFKREVKVKVAQRGEVLTAQGETAKSVFYLLKGAVYQHTANSVIDLHLESEWFFNHQSFVSQRPSDVEIAAFAESTMLEVSLESIHYLITKSPAFFQMNKIMAQAKQRLYFYDNKLSPLQQYQFIIDNKPELLQKFPLQIIALYLKIAPETLSRARERLFKRGS